MYSCVHMYHSRILLDYLTKIECKIGSLILEARASQIQSQNLNPTRSIKTNLLLHNDTVLVESLSTKFSSSSTGTKLALRTTAVEERRVILMCTRSQLYSCRSSTYQVYTAVGGHLQLQVGGYLRSIPIENPVENRLKIPVRYPHTKFSSTKFSSAIQILQSY